VIHTKVTQAVGYTQSSFSLALLRCLGSIPKSDIRPAFSYRFISFCIRGYSLHRLPAVRSDSNEKSGFIAGFQHERNKGGLYDPRQKQRIFSSSLCVQTNSEAHRASCTIGYLGSFSRGKERRGRADHSPYLVLG
jgi:hypothetical protein